MTRLLAADSDPVYVPSSSGSGAGSLLFLRDGTLMAQSFDGRSQVIGEPIPIAEDVGNLGSYGWFSASVSGALAFRTRTGSSRTSALLWLDRQGKRLGQVGPLADYSGSGVQLSPDGKRVVVSRTEGFTFGDSNVMGTRVWTAELTRGIFSRLNSGDGSEAAPAVSPDGRVAYSTNTTLNGAVGDLYWVPAGGVGSPEPLIVKSPTVKHPNDISPDGRFLIY